MSSALVNGSYFVANESIGLGQFNCNADLNVNILASMLYPTTIWAYLQFGLQTSDIASPLPGEQFQRQAIRIRDNEFYTYKLRTDIQVSSIISIPAGDVPVTNPPAAVVWFAFDIH